MAHSEAFQTIQDYFENFRMAVEQCRMAADFIAADWQDAYNRLARLRDRYINEKSHLHRAELDALSKVFEHDSFTDGMINIRHVAEHIKRPGTFTIRTTNNAPVHLSSEASAMGIFSASMVVVHDTAGNTHRLDHLKMLTEMENRISAAMSKAGR